MKRCYAFFGKNWRSVIGFWVLGMSINFGFWAVLTLAYNLISVVDDTDIVSRNGNGVRNCHKLSTGIILMCNIVPLMVFMVISPFIPLWIHVRMAVTVLCSVGSCVCLGRNDNEWLVYGGIVMASLSMAIGESSLFMYMPHFEDNKVVSSWSSGNGASAFLASLISNVFLSTGVSLSTTFYFMLFIPFITALFFWVVLKHPKKLLETQSTSQPSSLDGWFSITWKLLTKYTAPFCLVYYIEYTINQGLFELFLFDKSFIDIPSQVRWLTFIYALGTFISKSTGEFFNVKYLWIFPSLQATNFLLLISQAIYSWMGRNVYTFVIIVIIVSFEGLIAGSSYVITYRRINDEMMTEYKEFCMAVNAAGFSISVFLSSLTAIPLHNIICNMPPL